MRLLLTQEETQSVPVDEINSRLAEAFVYDDFAWQLETGAKVKSKRRAEGLHNILYQCASCGTEFMMTSSGITLQCNHCGKKWEMTEFGELRALDGNTEFGHIPNWYEWERSNVRDEVARCAYSFSRNVRIESLPNAKGFVKFPEPGYLTHNMDGFTLTGKVDNDHFSIFWSAPSLYSCHIEYDYKGRGDCVDLNTADDTFYLFPQGSDFAVTKIALATEEIHNALTLSN